MLHLHGFLTEVRCEYCDVITDIGYGSQQKRCDKCRGMLRPNVVFFGEHAPKYKDMYKIIEDVDLIVIIGTSGNVINVDNLIENAKYSILNNLEKSNAIDDTIFNKVIYDKATVAIYEIEKMVKEFIKGISKNYPPNQIKTII